jgi:polyvinyl alcohol dehydrogenase (cytochrome)
MSTRSAVAAVLALAALAAPTAASAAEKCAPADVPGGEWRNYGQNLSGDRYQRDEGVIGPATAPKLGPAWTFRPADNGGDGTFQSTPTVADGCVFLGTATGWTYALNADTGKVVWKRKLAVSAGGLLGSGAVGAPAVSGGRVYFLVSEAGDGEKHGPYVVALDQRDGRVVWGPVVVETKKFAYADSSPVVFDGVVFAGFNGDETYADSRGGFALLDARTGRYLRKTYTMPDDEYAAGAGGGSIWATPVVDRRTGFAFVGSANPTGSIESDRTNAILKIDLRRRSRRFGQIVDSVKGTPDSVSPVNPACGKIPVLPNQPGGDGALSAQSLACSRADYDFGASPNLITIGGRPAVAELQKSGYVHAAYTDGAMEKAWTALTGPGFFYDNLATTAADERNLYVTAGPPGQLIALDQDTGEMRWAAPIGDMLHFQSVSVANGVVYTIDSYGNLVGYDADTGDQVLRRDLAADTGDRSGFAAATSVGVAIARNSLFVANGGYIVRYAPGAGGDGAGGGGGGPYEPPALSAAAIAAGPAAANAGYATPRAIVARGGSVTFANGDAAQHNVVATRNGADGRPLFASALIGVGQTTDVSGVAKLAPGDYGFVCSIHAGMKGTLTVAGAGTQTRRVRQPPSLTDARGRVIRRGDR